MLALALALAAASAAAQIQVQAQYVRAYKMVYVSVTDRNGQPVQGLRADDFTLYEDGVPQKLRIFNTEPWPLSAAIVLQDNLPEAVTNAISNGLPEIIKAFGESDEIAFFRYSSSVTQMTGFAPARSYSKDGIRLGLLKPRSSGPPVIGTPHAAPGTPQPSPKTQVSKTQAPKAQAPQTPQTRDPGAPPVYQPPADAIVLNDAILLAAQDLSRRDPARRRCILIIGNGRNHSSTANDEDLRGFLLSQPITVYLDGINPAQFSADANKSAALFLFDFLTPQIVLDTGGEALPSGTQPGTAGARLLSLAQNQYTLGYTPPAPNANHFHSIEVRVRGQELHVHARAGYFSLPQPGH